MRNTQFDVEQLVLEDLLDMLDVWGEEEEFIQQNGSSLGRD